MEGNEPGAPTGAQTDGTDVRSQGDMNEQYKPPADFPPASTMKPAEEGFPTTPLYEPPAAPPTFDEILRVLDERMTARLLEFAETINATIGPVVEKVEAVDGKVATLVDERVAAVLGMVSEKIEARLTELTVPVDIAGEGIFAEMDEASKGVESLAQTVEAVDKRLRHIEGRIKHL